MTLVVLVETPPRGCEDRVAFQDATTATVAEILKSANNANERMAKIEAKIEAQQRELDRRPQ